MNKIIDKNKAKTNSKVRFMLLIFFFPDVG